MIVRFYGGPLHAQVREVPDNTPYIHAADALPMFAQKGNYPLGPLSVKTRTYLPTKDEYGGPLTNEDGEGVFRVVPETP